MLKLTQEQAEALENLQEDKEGIKTFLLILEHAVQARESEAGRAQVLPGKETEVLYRHLRAEGARQLLIEAIKVLTPKSKSKS